MNADTSHAVNTKPPGVVVLGIDPGPMARLEEVKHDPLAMAVIAQRVAGGETLRQVAKAWRVPHGPLLLWIMDDDGRMTTYRNARVAAGFTHADDALEIADSVPVQAISADGAPLFDEAGKPVLVENDVQRDKLRSDVRRWSAAKNAPEFFGERLDVQMHRALPSEEALLAQLSAMVSAQPWLLDELLRMRGNAAVPAGLTFTQAAAGTEPDASQNAESVRPAPDLLLGGSSAQAEGPESHTAPHGVSTGEKA